MFLPARAGLLATTVTAGSIGLLELIMLSSGVALLAAVRLVLVRARHAAGGAKAYLISLGKVAVALTWGLVRTIFTLRGTTTGPNWFG